MDVDNILNKAEENVENRFFYVVNRALYKTDTWVRAVCCAAQHYHKDDAMICAAGELTDGGGVKNVRWLNGSKVQW